MLKRVFIFLALLFAFAAGLLWGLSLALPGRSSREKLEEGLGPLVDRPQTQFAPALREEVFYSLPLGSSKSQVLRDLGPPLGSRVCPNGTICWDYSAAAASDASYFVRVLVFDGSGSLVRKRMGFVLGD